VSRVAELADAASGEAGRSAVRDSSGERDGQEERRARLQRRTSNSARRDCSGEPPIETAVLTRNRGARFGRSVNADAARAELSLTTLAASERRAAADGTSQQAARVAGQCGEWAGWKSGV
jgi:hypothetical protein